MKYLVFQDKRKLHRNIEDKRTGCGRVIRGWWTRYGRWFNSYVMEVEMKAPKGSLLCRRCFPNG